MHNMYKIKLSAETDTRKITIEIPCDADINELMDNMRTLALGLTYHEDSWDEAIQEKANELEYKWQKTNM
jgi:hypothetical protein